MIYPQTASFLNSVDRFTAEWPWFHVVIRWSKVPPPVSRLQATTAGCLAGLAIEISTGIRSATGNTLSQCHAIGNGIESARVGVLPGGPHGAHQLSMFHFQPNITMLQRARPMGNQEACAALHQALGGHHDRPLGSYINGTGGFIEQKDRRVLQKGPCYRDALAFPSRQAHPAFADHCLVPVG